MSCQQKFFSCNLLFTFFFEMRAKRLCNLLLRVQTVFVGRRRCLALLHPRRRQHIAVATTESWRRPKSPPGKFCSTHHQTLPAERNFCPGGKGKNLRYLIPPAAFHTPLGPTKRSTNLQVSFRRKKISVTSKLLVLTRFTKSGAMALTVMALGSHDENVRSAAAFVLYRFNHHLEARQTGKDNVLWLRYVEAICR